MKAVLMSIHPQWCAPILNGLKIIEIRKSKPNLKHPFKAYIYCTKKGGNLVLGDRFDGSSFLTEYAITRGVSKERADDTWGVLNGKVIGEFVCGRIDHIVHSGTNRKDLKLSLLNSDGTFSQLTDTYIKKTYLSLEEIENYAQGKDVFGWRISNLIIYDEPKALHEFLKPGYKSFEYMSDEEELCNYCITTDYGTRRQIITPNGPIFCEGDFCNSAYGTYLEDEGFRLYRPPQSWCYIEDGADL